MKFILRLFTNKYVVAVTAFAVWMIFFDARDIPTRMARSQELQKLNEKINYYQGEIESTQTELKNLQSNPATLEKYAREKYLMKKDNEEIFVEEPEQEGR